MILKEITYTPYKLQFSQKLVTAKSIYSERIGFILKITDEFGNTALGEASPLENFGSDTLINAEKSLKKIEKNFTNAELVDDFSKIKEFSSNLEISPTAHFAFDQCLLSLYFMRHREELDLTFTNRKLKVPVNFILGFNSEKKSISIIKKAINDGFKTFKLKVGKSLFDSDFKIIRAIRNEFGDSINIRLDANGKWTRVEAEKNISQIKQFNVQYIEQPVEGKSELFKLAKNVNIPIAPDECLKTVKDARLFLHNNSIKFIVLKPSLLGSLFNTFSLINEANEQKKVVVISSAFESVVGRSAVNFLASLTEHQYSHGLATAQLFNYDLANDSYKIENGMIDISKYPPEFE